MAFPALGLHAHEQGPQQEVGSALWPPRSRHCVLPLALAATLWATEFLGKPLKLSRKSPQLRLSAGLSAVTGLCVRVVS